jgi:hypothetical protein
VQKLRERVWTCVSFRFVPNNLGVILTPQASQRTITFLTTSVDALNIQDDSSRDGYTPLSSNREEKVLKRQRGPKERNEIKDVAMVSYTAACDIQYCTVPYQAYIFNVIRGNALSIGRSCPLRSA